jgi:hypothetical protein
MKTQKRTTDTEGCGAGIINRPDRLPPPEKKRKSPVVFFYVPELSFLFLTFFFFYFFTHLLGCRQESGEVPRYASSIMSSKHKRKVEFHDGASSASSSSCGVPRSRTRIEAAETSRTVGLLFN